MKDSPIAVVCDTVILVQGAGNPSGAAGHCLHLVRDERLTLFMSVEGIQEVHDVVLRPRFRTRFPQLTDDIIEAYLDDIRRMAHVVPTIPAHFRYARDPNDEHILNLALACKAEYLITHDNDLLDLKLESNPDGKAFRALVPELTIVSASDFLRGYRATSALSSESD